MSTIRKGSVMVLATAVLASVAAPAFATACCPSDDRTIAKTGMGRSAPQTVDVSLDDSWHVYAFERDGIPYLQVNDAAGAVRTAIGLFGDKIVTMPMGVDADRVSTPQRRLAIPTGSARSVVYRTDDMEFVAYVSGDGVTWSIEALVAP